MKNRASKSHDGKTGRPAIAPEADPSLQGEGNYTAARRHRKSLKEFIDSGKVAPAARDAAPRSPEQAQELRDAEAAGKAPSRR